jgi:DNA-directed RNA polymerase specialized sigma24 family protein
MMEMPKQNDGPDWQVVAAKLDLVARLLAYLVATQHDSLKKRAVALNSLGLSVPEIARVCNTTPNTVSVRLAEARKKPKGNSSSRATRRGGKR